MDSLLSRVMEQVDIMDKKRFLEWCINKIKGLALLLVFSYICLLGSIYLLGIAAMPLFFWPKLYRSFVDHIFGWWFTFLAVSKCVVVFVLVV